MFKDFSLFLYFGHLNEIKAQYLSLLVYTWKLDQFLGPAPFVSPPNILQSLMCNEYWDWVDLVHPVSLGKRTHLWAAFGRARVDNIRLLVVT